MSFIIEPALSALFEGLFHKLDSQEFLNFTRRHQLEAKIRKWTTMLSTIRAVLEDAEQKQLTRQNVKDWLGDLQHLAYDVEDVLDEFSYDILRRKVKAKNQPEDQSCTWKVKDLTPDFISGCTPKSLLFNSKMASKLEKITTRLEEIKDGIRTLNLLENVGAGASRRVWSRPPSSSVPNEPVFIGREREKRRIIELLMSHEQGDARIGVIPITGMGGLGKTALARSVYNDDVVKGSFEKIIWVCVSQDYDVTKITKEILEAVTSEPCNYTGLSLIQNKLHEVLSGKKFLLVLDDLWNEKSCDWGDLRPPLMHGASGSKVIVTTRLAEVADMVRTVAYEPLSYMSDEECWSIFCSHAFDWNGNSPTNSRFEEIGRKIVRKCSGLPLLAMTLGGLLRFKERDEDWKFVLNNKSWSFKDGKVDVLSVLRMSYYDLPSHLKRCFAYCAIFPEDFELEKDTLVFLWMAEGLIQSNQSEEDKNNIEDLGHSYFADLVSRSLFLPASGRESGYVMHDLVHDLAEEVASKTCYRVEKIADSPNHAIIERARHITFVRGSLRAFEFLRKMQVVRSILPLPWDYWDPSENTVPQNTITALLSNARYLRVLSFRGYEISELPEVIGSLKHLRYLDLSRTRVRSLPTSTTSLYNLHFLMLRECRELKKLPRDIWKLINLYHLDITDTGLDELPPGIAELKNLGRLSDFIVGKGHDVGLTTLRNLKLLRGDLRVSQLENVTSTEDARSAALSDKNNLEGLSLAWSEEPSDEETHGSVLEELQPHKDLKRLTIWSCRGASLPSWMVNLTLLLEIVIGMCPKMSGSLPLATTSLKRLSVSGCPLLVVKLPRLPELSELHITGCKEVDCAEDTNFDSLNKLTLAHIENVTSLVRKKVVEGMKHVRSLLLFGAHTHGSYSYRGDIVPFWSLENLSFVTSLMMDEDQGKMEEHVLSLVKVEHLYLFGFENLEKLPQWVLNAMCHKVNGLPSLQTQSDGGHFPRTLRSLQIKGCGELIYMAPGGKLPIGLEVLVVNNCPSLKKLSDGMHGFTSLQELKVTNCPGLESIVERFDDNVKSLRVLEIWSCPSLKKLPDGMHGFTSLQELKVTDCPGLESIAERFDDDMQSLRVLQIWGCPSLKKLPDGMHELTSLQELRVMDCQGLDPIPGGSLPTTLTRLVFSNNNSVKPLLEWGLHRLPCLSHLVLSGCPGAVCFPPEESTGMMLPQSLVYLFIHDFQDLEYLTTRGFQDLRSLKHFEVGNCPKLATFPDGGFPPSLEELIIDDCPLLKQNCLGTGWSSISRIPFICIDGATVSESDYRPQKKSCVPWFG